MLCHYWYSKDVRFKFRHVCNKCSIGCIFSKSKRIEILNIKGVDYRCILCGISRNKAVDILNNFVLEGKGVIIPNNFVLEDRGWINEINTYDWFYWYFRYCLGRRSQDNERQINRWNCE